jgi:hypothetical protein
MRSSKASMIRFVVPGLMLLSVGIMGMGCPIGLDLIAMGELHDSGVDKYIGQFTPVATSDVGDGWTKHTFDPDGGDGPICIAGTPFSAFTRPGNPSKLLIFEQGGGACWQNFYFCNILAEDQEPPAPPVGIWDFDNPDNPFADYSIVYMPYCDGSVFSGDNDVVDASFPFGPVRFHRGMRNQTAAMDLAKATFPAASKITISGSSAGGVGADGFAGFLARFIYGNTTQLTILNDAGPIAVNLNETGAIAARAADWDFGKFYPASCTQCDDMGEATGVIDWRLERDGTIREAWYETDGDATNRFFLAVPTQAQYRALILGQTDPLNASYPGRFKRFIKSGDDSHTALQTPLFYSQTVDGVTLDTWSRRFVSPSGNGWDDLVEDFIPLP